MFYDFDMMSNEEVKQEYEEINEMICIVSWDMMQQADEFDYNLKNHYQKRCDELEEELIRRGIFVD